MIAFDVFLAFVAATTLLMVIPGPNVALIVANSVAHGTRFGLLTVAGTASGIVLQLALTVVGVLCPLQRYQSVSHSPAALASPWADRSGA
jgi:threonine/homoserine/homoserine lactone efflux protein